MNCLIVSCLTFLFGNLEKVEEYFSKASKLDPDNVQNYIVQP